MIEFALRLAAAGVVLFVLAAGVSGTLEAGRTYAGKGDRLGVTCAGVTAVILFALGIVLTFAILVP